MKIALLLSLFSLQAEVPTRDFKLEAQTLAEQFVQAERVMGMSVGVISPDGEITTFGVGKLSWRNDQVPDERTLYEIGSVSKVLTGVLLADSVAREEVRLDDTVASILPKGSELAAHRKGPIQLVHLTTHSSGLPRMPKNFDLEDVAGAWASYGNEQLYSFLAEFKPRREPGRRYAYSNLAVGLLGHCLELRAGQPFESLLLDRLCKPLGMVDTQIRLGEEQAARFSPGHDANLDEASAWDMNVLAPCGGVRSSVADLLLFLQANLADESPLEESLALARTVHSVHRGKQTPVCLGWHLAGDGKTRIHSGQTDGYHSYLAVNTGLNMGVVVLGNTASTQIDALGNSLFNLALGIVLPGPEFKEALALEEAQLERYVGRFTGPDEFAVVVTRKGRKLYVQVDGPEQGVFRVLPISETLFEYVEIEASVEFELTEDAITGLMFRQNGLEIPCELKP